MSGTRNLALDYAGRAVVFARSIARNPYGLHTKPKSGIR